MSGNWAAVFHNLRCVSLICPLFPILLLASNCLFHFTDHIVAIDDILVALADVDPTIQMDANEALEKLGKVVHAMMPESLLIQPDVPD